MRPRIALCPRCHASMTPGERFCRSCGAVICPNCQELLPQRSRYCPRCGFLCLNEPVTEATAPRPTPPSPRQVFGGGQSFSVPLPGAQASMRMASESQSSTVRAVCPQCGSSIDLESGICGGCGLLYGSKHRVVQMGTSRAPAPPHYVPQQQQRAPVPPSAPTTHPASVAGGRHDYSVPPPLHSPTPAYQAPAVSARVGVGASPGQYSMPSVQVAHRYRQEVAEGAGAPDRLRQTLLKIVFGLFVLFILIFAGTGLYYLFSQETVEAPVVEVPASSPPPASTAVSPPVISDITISSLTDMTAVISWKTDKPATSQVRYGKTEACGLSTEEIKSLVTAHSVRLNALEPNTTYYFKVISKDASGVKAEVAGEPFKTELAYLVGTITGNRAPDFTLQAIDGKKITLSELRGKKVIVNFWATWCQPCKDEMPYIQEIHQEWSDKGVTVLAVAVNKNQALAGVEQFIRDTGYTFAVLFDSKGEVAELYQVSEIPKTVLIDADGIVQHVRLGDFKSTEEIDNILRSF